MCTQNCIAKKLAHKTLSKQKVILTLSSPTPLFDTGIAAALFPPYPQSVLNNSFGTQWKRILLEVQRFKGSVESALKSLKNKIP